MDNCLWSMLFDSSQSSGLSYQAQSTVRTSVHSIIPCSHEEMVTVCMYV